jgi:transketolase
MSSKASTGYAARETSRGAAEPRSLDRLAIDTIRTLAMDAVEKAKSGHPGTPMALAPVAYTLWQEFLRFDCDDPNWLNRDRFVLSNGHASMLLYGLLHLAQVKDASGKSAVTLEDIKAFRQLGSRCPGHPEYGLTAGIETTTGPLGQGCGTSVGMAIAQRWLTAAFNRPDFPVIDYDVYVFCSDGDLMEGVASEAASIAGHLKLSNLCWIYDNNHITIEGNTALTFSEDVGTRFHGYGWAVFHVTDANDTASVAQAISEFQSEHDRPTLIIVDSHIAYGAPNKQDTPEAHGEALGEEEVRLAKRSYGWPEDAHFLVPDGVYEQFRRGIGERGRKARQEWNRLFQNYRSRHPDLAARLDSIEAREVPAGWDRELPSFPPDPKGVATRASGGKVLNAIAENYPWLIGGAGDLGTSTKTPLTFADAGDFAPDKAGRNLHFGIREHGMGAILNGLAVTGLRPYGATFLIFSDYMKASIRLAALMRLPVIYVFTHDSIGLGEDGPTHQPIEQLAGLRAIPDLVTIRPADANEVVEGWRVIVESKRPVCLVLTRQALPTLDRSRYGAASGVARGGYVLSEAPGGKPQVILIGTGSEVSLCIAAQDLLRSEGVAARVVSLPSWELFDEQDEAYRDAVLPSTVQARVSVEAASTFGWERYVGSAGAMVGMHEFGASAPGKDVMKHFGFTPEAVAAAARTQVAKWSGR